MKAIVIMLVGLVLGGLLMNDQMSTTKAEDSKTEVVYGHRIGPDGNPILVTSR